MLLTSVSGYRLRTSVYDYVHGMNIAAPQKKQKKVLSEEEIRERELAKEAKKAERAAKKAEREAKKAEKAKELAAKKAEREAKAIAKGTWGTTTNLWAADKKPRFGKNGKMLRIQKPSTAGHKVWPRDKCRVKVLSNWTEEALAEYKAIYGEPYTEDTAATVVQNDTPNVIENVIVEAMAEANSAPAAPAVPKATPIEAPAEVAKPPAKKKKKKKSHLHSLICMTLLRRPLMCRPPLRSSPLRSSPLRSSPLRKPLLLNSGP